MEKVSVLKIEGCASSEEGWMYIDNILYEKGIDINMKLLNKAGILLEVNNVVNLLIVNGEVIYATSNQLVFET